MDPSTCAEIKEENIDFHNFNMACGLQGDFFQKRCSLQLLKRNGIELLTKPDREHMSGIFGTDILKKQSNGFQRMIQ